jgi:hypothetical protein
VSQPDSAAAMAGAALRLQVAALRAQADALEALSNTLGSYDDELLDVAACSKRFDVGREALRGAAARGELEISHGPRRKLLVKRRALEAWLASKPYKPTAKNSEPAPDLEAWERRVRRVRRVS